MRAATWARYAPQYRAEMRAGYGARTKPGPHRAAWERLLAKPSATLCCYCVDPARCHRRLLAEMLVACGAVYEGEREAPARGVGGTRAARGSAGRTP